MTQWEPVIGLEIHVQLATKTKMFCSCELSFGEPPNTRTCPVCLGLPGTLPRANAQAIHFGLMIGLALGSELAPRSIFHRKNYFYPDLPKGYQISQYELPIVVGGALTIMVGDVEKTVQLTRAHLEEDAGKSLHEDFHGMSGIDLNRAGTPLLEIVTEPDMASAEEAVAYAKALHTLVRWIGICDGNMQEGSFRCDANVSVRRTGEALGTRCEIKNLNSFNFMEKAIKFEIHRQIELIKVGGKVVQETRLYDPDRDETRSMRSKEDAMDYRYFPDPDLLPLEVTPQWITQVKADMRELPGTKRGQYLTGYGLSIYDAQLLTQSFEWADYFETALAAMDADDSATAAKQVANWMTGELAAALNRNEIDIVNAPIGPVALAGLLKRNADNTLNNKMTKEVFAAMWAGEGDADSIIATKGLKQISDSGEIEKIIDGVLTANAQQVADYRSGKEKAFNSLVGQVMKASKGKANPAQVNALLKQKLGAR